MCGKFADVIRREKNCHHAIFLCVEEETRQCQQKGSRFLSSIPGYWLIFLCAYRNTWDMVGRKEGQYVWAIQTSCKATANWKSAAYQEYRNPFQMMAMPADFFLEERAQMSHGDETRNKRKEFDTAALSMPEPANQPERESNVTILSRPFFLHECLVS